MPKSPSTVLDLETRLSLMRALNDNPYLSQRELAGQLGVSLGKTNYCLRALIEKGHVKAGNFRSNPNKSQCMYQLTPQGLAAKAKITARFLKRKIEEHEALQIEIEALTQEVRAQGVGDGVIDSAIDRAGWSDD